MDIELVFPPKLVDLQNYYYFKEGFSHEELDKIYKDVGALPFNDAVVGFEGEPNKKIRSSKVKWIPKNEHFKWIYEKLMSQIIEANNALWDFNLISVLEQIQYTEYHADDQGHYNWHQDIGPGPMSTRKVSITVQLSGPDEYTGGDLEFWRGGDLDNVEKAPKNKGLVFIFPSFMMHRVTKVETGIRRSFVLWVGGEHFK
jgi:PKHD-type hydroxylase